MDGSDNDDPHYDDPPICISDNCEETGRKEKKALGSINKSGEEEISKKATN